MKVSIITTVYKADNDLPRLLESMMAQKSQELEFFLIDNGSPDKCGDICRAYAKKDSRFTVFTIKDNVGYIRARNIGMKECSGDYIGFCDSDDYLEIGGYDRAIEKIRETDCDLYITAYHTVSENTQVVNKVPYEVGTYENDKIQKVILPQAFGNINGKSALHGFAWKQLCRRNLILENNLTFLPELQPYEDQIFNIDMIKKCSRIYIDDNVIYNYIVNEQSITAKLVSNFDAQAEWNRIKLFWGEKKSRATEQLHIEAYNNQTLNFIYSMLLNMAKTNTKSVKELAKQLDDIMDGSVVREILENSSRNNGKRLDFVKDCLLKQKYSRLFLIIRMALKIRQ